MKFILTAAAAALAGTTAFAGGLTPPFFEKPVVSPAAQVETGSDWTGAYVGLQYNKGDTNVNLPASAVRGATSGASAEGDVDGYGIYAGYLHDFGKFVIGGELGFNKIEAENLVGSIEGQKVNLPTKGSLNSWGLHARAGYDAGKFLPYVTLGTVTGFDETGVSYGLGADYKVTEKFTLGGQYTRQSFSDPRGIKGADIDIDLFQIRGAYHF